MATTSPDNLRTPDPEDPYNLVADLATMASDVQSALTKRANRYIGTTAQMNATSAADGTEWFNTTNKNIYLRINGSWRLWTTTTYIMLSAVSPFSPYTAGNEAGVLTLRNGMVYMRGVVGVASVPASQTTMLQTLPVDYRPGYTHFEICQGSGSNRWLLQVTPGGVVSFDRYSGTGSNVWLPYASSWPVAV